MGEHTPRPALHPAPKAAVYKAIKSGEPTLVAFTKENIVKTQGEPVILKENVVKTQGHPVISKENIVKSQGHPVSLQHFLLLKINTYRVILRFSQYFLLLKNNTSRMTLWV